MEVGGQKLSKGGCNDHRCVEGKLTNREGKVADKSQREWIRPSRARVRASLFRRSLLKKRKINNLNLLFKLYFMFLEVGWPRVASRSRLRFQEQHRRNTKAEGTEREKGKRKWRESVGFWEWVRKLGFLEAD